MPFYSGTFGFNVRIRQNTQRPEIIGFTCSFFPSQKLFPVKIGFFFVTLQHTGSNTLSLVHLGMA